MPGNILIIKKRGQKTGIRITKEMRKGYSPDGSIVINLDNYKDVALMLHDLKDLYNVPIDKAILEYKSGRQKGWPFQLFLVGFIPAFFS